jgi:hypothetical protein
MNTSVMLSCLWVILAFVMASIPSNDSHWRRARVLIALGIPLLVYLIWQSGPVIGLIGLIVGCLVLRWPVLYLWRWVRGKRVH